MIGSCGAGIPPVCGSRVLGPLVVLGALLVAVPGCGKKGPPLPPLVNRPRAPEAVSARRMGAEVQIRFTVPRSNQSGVQPANIERVDVYAMTGPKPDARSFLEHAAVVASVPVNPPPPPEEDTNAPPRRVVNPVAVDQGAQAAVNEALTPQALQPIELSGKERRPPQRPRPTYVVVRRTELAPPDTGAPVAHPVLRHYAAVGVARGGRRGAVSSVVSVSLADPPSAPGQPVATVRERSIELTWEGRGALRGRAEEPVEAEQRDTETPEDEGDRIPAAEQRDGSGRATDRPLPSRSYQPWPTVRSGFNVYAVSSATSGEPPASPYSAARLPQLLNPKPVTTTRFEDRAVQFGQERCYVVRTVETTGTAAVESPPSPAACIKVADVFPPSAPRSLAAVAAERTINLIWEPNTESDLAGYLVLRGADGAALEVQFTQPIRETMWRDASVKPGVKYRYAVVAVDNASPGNRSTPSNEVEVSLR